MNISPRAKALIEALHEVASNERAWEIAQDFLNHAGRTRADYDLRCDACGAPHNLDTSIPSKVWNVIAPEGGVLCTLCIDERMAKAGLKAEAEFYFVGAALRSKHYAESQGEVEHLERHVKALREAVRDVESILSGPLRGTPHLYRVIQEVLDQTKPEPLRAEDACGPDRNDEWGV